MILDESLWEGFSMSFRIFFWDFKIGFEWVFKILDFEAQINSLNLHRSFMGIVLFRLLLFKISFHTRFFFCFVSVTDDATFAHSIYGGSYLINFIDIVTFSAMFKQTEYNTICSCFGLWRSRARKRQRSKIDRTQKLI